MSDFHIHSIYSDGGYTIKKIVEKAKQLDLKAIALTDHDTIDGVASFLEYAKEQKITAISGCEFSGKPPYNPDYTELHILAYNFKNLAPVYDFMKLLKEKSFEYAKNCVFDAQQKGIDVDFERIIADNVGIFTCIDYVKYLIKIKAIKTTQEGYDKFIHNNKTLIDIVSPREEIMQVINESGAISVLAHPFKLKMNNDDLRIYVKELVNLGLNGIEVWHNGHTKENIAFYRELAKEFGLIETGGSDFHDDDGRGNEIGHYVSEGKKYKLDLKLF
ncbi:MAG: PHP domain-containing protein [Rickettsiales bacterium]|nr:MAG: PHP domain-containing protein [Rickettsiales bacterium]